MNDLIAFFRLRHSSYIYLVYRSIYLLHTFYSLAQPLTFSIATFTVWEQIAYSHFGKHKFHRTFAFAKMRPHYECNTVDMKTSPWFHMWHSLYNTFLSLSLSSLASLILFGRQVVHPIRSFSKILWPCFFSFCSHIKSFLLCMQKMLHSFLLHGMEYNFIAFKI